MSSSAHCQRMSPTALRVSTIQSRRRRRPRDTTMRRQPCVLVLRQYQRISSLSVGACGPRTGSVRFSRAVIFLPGAVAAARPLSGPGGAMLLSQSRRRCRWAGGRPPRYLPPPPDRPAPDRPAPPRLARPAPRPCSAAPRRRPGLRGVPGVTGPSGAGPAGRVPGALPEPPVRSAGPARGGTGGGTSAGTGGAAAGVGPGPALPAPPRASTEDGGAAAASARRQGGGAVTWRRAPPRPLHGGAVKRRSRGPTRPGGMRRPPG
ncbi:uncharacterized protein LOC141731056 [Zonotrichia albicollis]|uniref:uncharacterized protein LOC141731056 n=1 Tax=Zonotrichia albicollis TaxID=44394 RepID=UPI003D80D925